MDSVFDHVALSSIDIGNTVSFYTQHFKDAEILYQDDSWALIRIGSTKIAFVREEQHPPHLAFRVESLSELERQARELGKATKLHRDGSISFYFDDPTGNAVEMIHYPGKS